jgi:hypothetical protein
MNLNYQQGKKHTPPTPGQFLVFVSYTGGGNTYISNLTQLLRLMPVIK